MTEVICHRGYSSRYPENTMLAFQKAIETGADGIELDVHLTRDGEVVVIHDELVDRTTDGVGFVKDFSLAELRRLNAAHGWEIAPQRVPTLEEYLERIAPTGLQSNIELKTGMFDYDGIEEKVWKLIDRFGLKDRVILSSFHVQTLLRLKALAPEAPCGLLNQDRIIHPGWATQALGLRAYHPLYLRLRPSVIRELKEHDVEVNAYTVNGHGPLAYLFLADIHSVITNQPRRALALRRLIQGNSGLKKQKNVVK